MAGEACGNCLVWLKFTAGEEAGRKGICRLNPSTPMQVGVKGDRAVYDSVYPVLRATDWCFQWKPKLRAVK